jgi:hypothetical protein
VFPKLKNSNFFCQKDEILQRPIGNSKACTIFTASIKPLWQKLYDAQNFSVKHTPKLNPSASM